MFSVSLLKDGGLFVDGRAVASDDAIRTEAEAAHAAHPDLRAVIRADGDVPHRRVVHIMDLLSQANITQIAFAIEPEAPPRAAP